MNQYPAQSCVIILCRDPYMEPVPKASPNIYPADRGFFAGVLDYSKMNIMYRMIVKSKMKKQGVPEGNFRSGKPAAIENHLLLTYNFFKAIAFWLIFSIDKFSSSPCRSFVESRGSLWIRAINLSTSNSPKKCRPDKSISYFGIKGNVECLTLL